MKKFIAFAFFASIVIGSVGCKSDGNGNWCMRNPFYRRPVYQVACPPVEVPCVDSCCGVSAGFGASMGFSGSSCDACNTPALSGTPVGDPIPTL